MYGTQVHIPAAAAGVVRVTDLVAKLRAFAADFTNFCHDRKLPDFLLGRALRLQSWLVRVNFTSALA